MSSPWEGADSLVGFVVNMPLGNGKPGGVALTGHHRNGFTHPTISPGYHHHHHAGTIIPQNPQNDVNDLTHFIQGVDLPQYAAVLPAVGLPAPNGFHHSGNGYHHPQHQLSAAAYPPVAPATGPYQAVNGMHHELPAGAFISSAVPLALDPAYNGHPMMGWGGQAIHDTNGFKAPWFGKGGRGRNGNGFNGDNNGNGNGRGRNRGRANGGIANGNGGRNGNKPRRSGFDALDDASGADATIEVLVNLVSSVPNGQPLGDATYQALFQLEGRSCALLLKELARAGLHKRAGELFDWVRNLQGGHPLLSLLDVYSYTAAISLCIVSQNVDRAVTLAGEMQGRGIQRNVHTYTALMNVCIKCSKHELALDTYRAMRAEGCAPNVVTYNTLIDVHGKMGAWEEAVAVLGIMKAEGIEPVLRTYNTLLIACNMCSQPREAVAVYRRMLEEGFSPNSTTYNALISAYGKAGQLDRVMEVFQEMVYRGCERNVITYSSLISACEKAGRWEVALELFQEMIQERCTPNTVTFNSLITALGQGAQWEKAQEVFEEMQSQGCTPDVVTYTTLISSLEKGGQWRMALAAFERMRRQGCRADAIVYNAIVDTLWETGVVWAQRKALAIFRSAVGEGHFGQGRLMPGMLRAEVNLHAMTAGVAVLSLYAWLMSLKQLVQTHGSAAAPAKLVIVTDRCLSRGAKEQGNLVVKEAVAALMVRWEAPFKAIGAENGSSNAVSGTLEATGPVVAAWVVDKGFEARLFGFFPCTDILPSVANSGQVPTALAAVGALLDDPGHEREIAVERRCSEAYAAVRLFEKTHCLALQNMGYAYLQHRSDLVARCNDVVAALGVQPEASHDAVLLMDRVMSTSLTLPPELLDLLAAACVLIAVKQVDGSVAFSSTDAEVQAATGFPAAATEQMDWNIRQILRNDTAAISTLRCLKLYLERLGAHHMDAETAEAMAGGSMALVDDCLTDVAFLNCRPSVIAAAVLYTDRRARGVIPFWPTMLAKLTGYQDMSTPELSVAIKAAQRSVNGRTGEPPSLPNGTVMNNGSMPPHRPQSAAFLGLNTATQLSSASSASSLASSGIGSVASTNGGSIKSSHGASYLMCGIEKTSRTLNNVAPVGQLSSYAVAAKHNGMDDPSFENTEKPFGPPLINDLDFSRLDLGAVSRQMASLLTPTAVIASGSSLGESVSTMRVSTSPSEGSSGSGNGDIAAGHAGAAEDALAGNGMASKEAVLVQQGGAGSA